MSAKAAGRALLITTVLILLAVVLAVAAVAFDTATAGDDGAPRPATGQAPVALPVSHRHQPGSGDASSIAAPPPKPKDVYAYLPLLTRPPNCDLNPEEEAIAALAVGHEDQERENMSCNPILAQVARAHAVDMAASNYFTHTNPAGFGPNYRVEQAGYELPDWYDQAPDANNIESIAAGYPTPEAAWNGWLDSPGHRNHVLGESEFFADQTNYGIGYAFSAGSDYKHYWVFISAPPPEN